MTDETGASEPLRVDPRYMSVRRMELRLTVVVGAALTLLVLLIVLAAADDLPGWGRALLGGGWLAVVVVAARAAGRWPAREYAQLGYLLGADALCVWRGVYWRRAIEVPRSRVQHTDVSQGPLERRHGLGTLVVYTAGTDHARVALSGLAHEVALALRDELRQDHRDDIV